MQRTGPVCNGAPADGVGWLYFQHVCYFWLPSRQFVLCRETGNWNVQPQLLWWQMRGKTYKYKVQESDFWEGFGRKPVKWCWKPRDSNLLLCWEIVTSQKEDQIVKVPSKISCNNCLVAWSHITIPCWTFTEGKPANTESTKPQPIIAYECSIYIYIYILISFSIINYGFSVSFQFSSITSLPVRVEPQKKWAIMSPGNVRVRDALQYLVLWVALWACPARAQALGETSKIDPWCCLTCAPEW